MRNDGVHIYWKLKEEALRGTLWRTRLGSGHGPVVRLRDEDHGDNELTTCLSFC